MGLLQLTFFIIASMALDNLIICFAFFACKVLLVQGCIKYLWGKLLKKNKPNLDICGFCWLFLHVAIVTLFCQAGLLPPLKLKEEKGRLQLRSESSQQDGQKIKKLC